MSVGGPCSIKGCKRTKMYNSSVCHKHRKMSFKLTEKSSELEQVETEQQRPSGEELECPKGCGIMSYEDIYVGDTDLSNALFFVIPLLAGIYFIGSFFIFHSGDSEYDSSQFHPSVGILGLFAIIWVVSILSGIIYSKTHACASCNGIMMEEKAMAYIFDEPSLVKINLLIDSMTPSSSDLQCSVCNETMGKFSVPYIPADDYDERRHNRGNQNIDAGGLAVGLAIALVVVAVKTIVPNAEQKIHLDACRECRTVWFDSSEKNQLELGTIVENNREDEYYKYREDM